MPKKNFILDTNVLLSDLDALSSFEDNNIIIPIAVLEELDKKKSGNELAFILLQDIGKANKVSGLSNKEVEKSILEAF